MNRIGTMLTKVEACKWPRVPFWCLFDSQERGALVERDPSELCSQAESSGDSVNESRSV